MLLTLKPAQLLLTLTVKAHDVHTVLIVFWMHNPLGCKIVHFKMQSEPGIYWP